MLFPAYLAGFNLIESFYLAIPHLSWQTIVVGDPLCAPFPRIPPAAAASIQRSIRDHAAGVLLGPSQTLRHRAESGDARGRDRALGQSQRDAPARRPAGGRRRVGGNGQAQSKNP